MSYLKHIQAKKFEALFQGLGLVLCSMGLSACAHMGTQVGISLPVGKIGGVGVTVGSGGTVSGTVGVSVGGGSVQVGTSGQLPKSTKPQEENKPQDGKP
jgi:hypothetical protein